jgi:cytochrome c oxidase subunit 3
VSGPVIIDRRLERLPTFAFGTRNLIWWGTTSFMMIEGMAFVLAAGGYLYLRGRGADWPPAGTRPPDLLWGTLLTLVLLASLIPNIWLEKKAHERDLKAVQLGMLVMTGAAVLALIVRAFEFPHLNCRWDFNAYGSITWALMVLHTAHILTDAADTAALTCFMFTHDVDGERFSDVTDNANYWNFVVLSWLPIYALVYWAPRLL